jgi:hypothetical protein
MCVAHHDVYVVLLAGSGELIRIYSALAFYPFQVFFRSIVGFNASQPGEFSLARCYYNWPEGHPERVIGKFSRVLSSCAGGNYLTCYRSR